jgi:hypothetical protein
MGQFGSLTNILGGFSRLGNLFGGNNALVSGTKVAAGYSNTVNRQTVDAAVVRILGNPKIQPPTFGYPSANSTGKGKDVSSAQKAIAEKGVVPIYRE